MKYTIEKINSLIEELKQKTLLKKAVFVNEEWLEEIIELEKLDLIFDEKNRVLKKNWITVATWLLPAIKYIENFLSE